MFKIALTALIIYVLYKQFFSPRAIAKGGDTPIDNPKEAPGSAHSDAEKDYIDVDYEELD